MTLSDFLTAVQAFADTDPRYKLGHAGDDDYCDCIGLIIGACERNGIEWTGIHGTNWWARHYTRNLEQFSSARELRQGDLVFKARSPGHRRYDLPSRYNKHPDRLDYYHVGVVQSVRPLRIIHCTTPGIRIDSRRGSWSHHGQLTLLDESPDLPLLRYGARNDSVRTLQLLLREAGYTLEADGIFGPMTREAVRSYQEQHGLVPDGIVGPLTWGELYHKSED